MASRSDGLPALTVARPGTARLLLEAMRPRQWSKNAFVLGGLVFSGTVTDLGNVAVALSLLGAFCAVSGATYLLNDVVDAESDRHNPRTASRPIARGALDKRTALVAAVVLATVAVVGTAFINVYAALCLVAFSALQLAYSLKLKHVLLIDVMAIAAGFVLRALAGLVAIDVEISEWLLICTGLLALVLGLGKRRGELMAVGGGEHPHRPVLDDYSVALVDELLTVVTPSTLVAYCLYGAIGARTQVMLLTVPFVIYGVFRMLYLLHRSTLPEDPATAVLDDRPLLICVVLWGVTAGVISQASV
jgi:4-hydroxybenzoate polyprenyltransferase